MRRKWQRRLLPRRSGNRTCLGRTLSAFVAERSAWWRRVTRYLLRKLEAEAKKQGESIEYRKMLREDKRDIEARLSMGKL